MKYNIFISNHAKEDIVAVLKWYKINVPDKVFAELKSILNKTVKSLIIKPERFQIRYNQHRAALIPKFHLQLHYYIDQGRKQVIVTALFHDKQNTDHLNDF